MRAFVVLFVAAGCYTPRVIDGVACDPGAPACPAGQMCLATADGFRCERGPGEEPSDSAVDVAIVPDGMPNPDAAMLDPQGDEDGDGRKNLDDNCVFIANADQHDEDSDKLGDACDPCPIFAAGLAADADGDGVGDACDPNPTTAGDRIYVFESFKAGIPTTAGWDSYGTWGGNDAMNVNLGAADHANISYTMPAGGNETITTQLQLMGLSGMGTNRGVGTIDEKGDAGSDGVACDLFADTGEARKFGLVHANTSAGGADELMTTALAWNQNQRYVVTQHRRNASYTCTTGTTSVTGTSAITNPVPQVGLWASNTGARFDYLFVVTSP